MKNYKAIRLPFKDQKRNFVEPFKKALKELKENDIIIITDLYGDSGLFSHMVKVYAQRPRLCTVIMTTII